MISRDEAKELSHDGSGFLTQETVCLIDEIYDSRGSCGECKYLLEKGKCRLHSVDAEADVIMMNNDFCSYFERKEQ